MTSKKQLRTRYRRLRDWIPMPVQRKAGSKIAKNLFKTKEMKQAKMIGVYFSKGSEVRTIPIIKKLFQLKKTIALPKVLSNPARIQFHAIKSLKDCHLGSFNILEPFSQRKKIPAQKLDLILVPGIAFDKKGFRIGYGKGFYDRFLKQADSASTIGLSYQKTLIPKIPRSKTDLPVQSVITEKKIFRFRN